MNVFWVGFVIYKITRSSPFSAFGAALFLLSESFISIHTFALSEPLFVFQILIILLILNSYLNESKLYKVPILGIMTGVAYLTRYVGVSVFGMVLLEALACGLKIVSTPCPAAKDLSREYRNQFRLVPIGNVNAFGEACLSLFKHDRITSTNDKTEHYLKKMTWTSIAADMLAAIQSTRPV